MCTGSPSLARIVAVFLLLSIAACSSSATRPPVIEQVRPELEKYFQGFNGAFVFYDLDDNRYIRYNPEGCTERLLPASTFKIMNALVALETGVVEDQNDVISWDGTQFPISVWNQDHTLKTAFQDSVVWYYQELARRIGRERMQHYIDAVEYGNQNLGPNVDSFWLDGSLQISADEQVEFLKRLYQGDLPFSKRSIEIVRDIMILESDPAHQLSGKTGSGQMGNLSIGWFVGYEEKKGNVYFFALNITSSSPEANGSKARGILLEILRDETILDIE